MNRLWMLTCVLLWTSGNVETSSWQAYITSLEGQAGGADQFFAGGLFLFDGTLLAWKGSFQPTAEQASFLASVCRGAYFSDIEKAENDGIKLGDGNFKFIRREADKNKVYFNNDDYSGMARTSKTILIIGIDDGTNPVHNKISVDVNIDHFLTYDM